MDREEYIDLLWKQTRGDQISLALQIRSDVTEEKNTLAIDLLNETGDKKVTGDTYFKAADIIINEKSKA